MTENGYQIMILNLLRRSIEIELAKGKPVKMDKVEKTLEELKDLVRKQYLLFNK